jgi:DNA-binding response OmpR family regulator
MNRELLIVEDEDDIREVLVDSLGSLFSKVHEARNGQEGLDILNTVKPSLIITDFNMPKLDGVEFIKMLKSKHMNIPIIVLTGRGSQDVRRQVWAYGIWEYFEKPFDIKDLTNCVHKVLSMFPEDAGLMDNPVGMLHFQEITVMLEKQHFVPFEAHCLKHGLSPSSKTKELILKYLKEISDDPLKK